MANKECNRFLPQTPAYGKQYQQLIYHQQSTARKISDALSALGGTGLSTERVHQLLLDLQNENGCVGEHHRKLIAHINYNSICFDAGVAAQKVFDVPEMLEQILLSLDFEELLLMRQVSKAMCCAIDCSPRVQVKLFLRADEHSHLDLLQRNRTGSPSTCFLVSRAPPGRASSDSQKIEVIVVVGLWAPRMGDLGRKMLIANPPVFKMMGRREFSCGHLESELSDGGVVENSDGVTVGDILDTIDRVKAHAVRCPNTSGFLSSHHAEAWATVELEFTGEVTLTEDDPILVLRR